MNSTRLSLLAQASSGSNEAWLQLVELYQPLIYGWLRRHDVEHHDAEELTQDVLGVLVAELSSFDHSGRRGAFRTWLRQITANRAKGFWRAKKVRRTASGSAVLQLIEQLGDDCSDLSRLWDREHDRHVLRELLRKVESRFEPATVTAFQRQVFDGATAKQVAEDLDLTLVAAYCAKSRILRMLRQEAMGLVDNSLLA